MAESATAQEFDILVLGGGSGGYAAALRALRGYGANEIEALRRGGYAAVGRHTLEHERMGFAGFMGRLSGRLGRPAPDGADGYVPSVQEDER